MLSEQERARWQSYRFDRDRRQYLATRVLVRTALSYRLNTPPESLRFSSNPWGKPRLHPETRVRFNISNCPDLVMCLIAEQTEVGVDAEPTQRAFEVAALGAHIFSAEEQRQLDRLPQEQQLDRALTLWTLKEAWAKARGMGLTIPPNKTSFLFSNSGPYIHLEVEEQFRDGINRDWHYCVLSHAGHRIALMIDGSPPSRLPRWELHPLLAQPRCLPDCSHAWYPIIHL